MFAMFAKFSQVIFFLHNISQLVFFAQYLSADIFAQFFQPVFFAQYISAGIMANQADFCACSLICGLQ